MVASRRTVLGDVRQGGCELAAQGRARHPLPLPNKSKYPNLLKNTVLAWKVLRKERPDLIISSGAAVAVPFFVLGKLLGAKCVYVEVFDRVDKPTMTGRMLNGIADLFVVQWPEQLEVYKHAVNLGSIF